MLKTTFPSQTKIIRTANEIDRTLIEILRKDGRAIGRTFAERTELSEATISRRLAILDDSHLVKVRGYVDFQDSQCNAASIIRFSTTESPSIFAQALARRSCFYRVATIAGQSEIVAFGAAVSASILLTEIESILTAHPDVVIEQASTVLAIIPPREARKVINALPAQHPSSTDRQNKIHAKIIRALQLDFRTNISALAATAGISPPAAATTLHRMLELDEIRHVVSVDPHFMARPLCAQLRIAVRRNINKTAQGIADTLDPDWVFICLQREQILIEVSVTDEVDLLRCQQDLKKIPGVVSVACSPFSAIYKQDFDWNGDEPHSSAA